MKKDLKWFILIIVIILASILIAEAKGSTRRSQCNNGIDDDNDGLIDYKNDPGCSSLRDKSETSSTLICDNGIDETNDSDDFADFRLSGGDPGCISPTDSSEVDGECDDLIDNDNDTYVDYSNDRDDKWIDLSKSLNSLAPPILSGHVMVYDSWNNLVVLFGGVDNNNQRKNETWVFHLANKTWVNMTPADYPPSREQSMMAFDKKHSVVVMYGGSVLANMRYNDTWIYNYSINSWTNMNPVVFSNGRRGAGFSYDSEHNVSVMFGGNNGSAMNETWIYDLTFNNWTKLNPAIGPRSRAATAMAYDSVHKVHVLFGGGGKLNDTWYFNLSSRVWTNLTNLERAPYARTGHSLAFDSLNDYMVLFGGSNNDNIRQNDTWLYNFTSSSWIKRNHSNVPPIRSDHGMVYNIKYKKIVLYGGEASSTSSYNDTWIYAKDYDSDCDSFNDPSE